MSLFLQHGLRRASSINLTKRPSKWLTFHTSSQHLNSRSSTSSNQTANSACRSSIPNQSHNHEESSSAKRAFADERNIVKPPTGVSEVSQFAGKVRRNPRELTQYEIHSLAHVMGTKQTTFLSRTKLLSITKKLDRETEGQPPFLISKYTRLNRILAKYIHFCGSDGEWRHQDVKEVEERAKKYFGDPTFVYLRSRGYTMRDVASWSWVICTSGAEQANRRLSFLLRATGESRTSELPITILSFILHATDPTPGLLRGLLEHAKYKYMRQYDVGRQLSSLPGSVTSLSGSRQVPVPTSMDEASSLKLFARFINHARRVLPEALDDVAAMACSCLRGTVSKDESVTLTPDTARRLTRYYNDILRWLSSSSRSSPYRSVPYQQRAQFQVLRRMTEFSPHLPVTRQGFRAMIRVQVAHVKTDAEREWASYKAITWPPWKKDKLGLDVGQFFEGSISRARQVLNRMVEAGYELRDWERIAQILSGWDVDGSPTIQTRKWMPPIPGDERCEVLPGEIARARIFATRTVREAWACFLDYERSTMSKSEPFQTTIALFEAMLERLLAKEVPYSSEAIPGDGIEHYPEPTSPHDFLYLPEEPPTPAQLIQRMKAANLQPSYRICELLIDHETNFANVIAILESHNKLVNFIPHLVHREQSQLSRDQAPKKTLNRRILNAYVRFLCRIKPHLVHEFQEMRHKLVVKYSNLDDHAPKPSQTGEVSEPYTPRISNLDPFDYALAIVRSDDISSPSTWMSLLYPTLRSLIPSELTDGNARIHQVWDRTRLILSSMDRLNITIDFNFFDEICDKLCDVLPMPRNDPMNEECLVVVKNMFSHLVEGSARRDVLSGKGVPTFKVAFPGPYSLLAFVRVLGLTGDRGAIVTILRGVAASKHRLQPMIRETLRGQRQLRDMIVTARIHLEGLWQDRVFLQGYPPSAAPGSRVQRARRIVESVPEWGGWPSDEEARNACLSPAGKNDWKLRMQQASVSSTQGDVGT